MERIIWKTNSRKIGNWNITSWNKTEITKHIVTICLLSELIKQGTVQDIRISGVKKDTKAKAGVGILIKQL